MAATLQRAENCGLKWPLPEEMSDKQLSECLFLVSASKSIYMMPDYAYIHKELQRSGVTLNLLWLEYCDQCLSAGEIPYQSTQFNKYYADYLAKANATMHLNHKPGEIMQVDWAGDTVGIISTFILAALRNRQFLSLPELNEAIHERLEAFNRKPFQKRDGSRASSIAEEKPFLRPLPPRPFEYGTSGHRLRAVPAPPDDPRTS